MQTKGSALAVVLIALIVSACGSDAIPSAPPSSPVPATIAPTGATTSAPPSASPMPAARDLAMYALPQANELLRGAAVASLASGPSGVVILGHDRATGALITWTSPDGDSWERHWLPGATFGGGTPDLLVGGVFGYLALGWGIEPATTAMREGMTFPRALWTSPDGVSWTPAPDIGLPNGAITGLASGPAGVAALIEASADRQHSTVAVTSDGSHWHEASMPDGAIPYSNGLVATPEGFLLLGAIDTVDSTGGTSSTDVAWRSTDGIAWTADPGLARQLHERENPIDSWQSSPWGVVGWSSGSVGLGPALLTAGGLQDIPPVDTGSWAAQVVAGPAGIVWLLGADRAAACVSAWQYDEGVLRPLDGTHPDVECLNAAGPAVLGSAAMPEGMVIIGTLGTDPDRVAWLVRGPGRPPTGAVADGPPPSPPAASIPDPLAIAFAPLSTCPPAPTTMAALQELSPALAAGCFGDRTITVRAWVLDPGEGYGGTCGAFEPAWIRECVLPDYFLIADRSVDGADVPTLNAMRSPKATGDLIGVSRWVRVKGHYDDAASASCRGGGVDIGFEPEPPTALLVSACRLVFVVTDIRTTD
jgi:hypothetical protein